MKNKKKQNTKMGKQRVVLKKAVKGGVVPEKQHSSNPKKIPLPVLCKQVLDNFSPKNRNEILAQANEMVKKINSLLKKSRIAAVAVLGGSAAKGTFLRVDFDCDIFVQFEYTYKDKNLSDLLEKVIKAMNPVRLHGSRDYFKIQHYEIVPVLKISKAKMAVNVTDASPLHVQWVRKRMRKNPKLANEIMLAKVFCKAQGVYGAESYIRGFSGHVLDILLVNYGSFLKLLKESQKWEVGKCIDVEKHKSVLNMSKTQGPLVIIDPVQPERNAAAAVSEEKFIEFKKKAKEFLSAPSYDFFVQKKLDKQEIIKKGGIVITIEPHEGKRDIVGCQVLKIFTTLKSELEEFEISSAGWEWKLGEDALLWFKVKNRTIDPEFVRRGPPLDKFKFVEEFKKCHKKTFVKEGVMYAYIPREFTVVDKKVTAILLQKDMKERMKNFVIESVDSSKIK